MDTQLLKRISIKTGIDAEGVTDEVGRFGSGVDTRLLGDAHLMDLSDSRGLPMRGRRVPCLERN